MISPPTGCSSAWLERCVWDAEVRRFESGHPREEWDTLLRGVDREAVDAMSARVDEFVARDQRR